MDQSVVVKPLPALPGPVWARIFQHLTAFSLARVRLTCREWNEIVVGTQPLVDKFELAVDCFFTGELEKDSTRRKKLLSGLKTRYTRAALEQAFHLHDDAAWEVIGANLRTFAIRDGWTSFAKIAYVLKFMPNLVELTCSPYSFDGGEAPEVDFRLDKLEVLTLAPTYEGIGVCLNMFRQSCAKLRVLKMDSKRFDCDEETLYQFIDAFRDTLEEVHLKHCGVSEALLPRIISMDRLELKKLSLGGSAVEADVLQLCLVQPLIEHLDIRSVDLHNSETLTKIGDHLPFLKTIMIDVSKLGRPNLESMRNLEHLEIISGRNCQKLDLSQYMNPLLRVLSLKEATLTDNSLQSFTTNLPNVRSLTLKAVKQPSGIPEDVLVPLEYLKLKEIDNLESIFRNSDTLWNLKQLEIVSCDIPPGMFSNIARSCPKLERIRLKEIHVTDEDLQLLSRQLNRLKEVHLNWCTEITDASVDDVLRNCQDLEWFRTEYCRKIKQDEQRMRDRRCRVSIGDR